MGVQSDKGNSVVSAIVQACSLFNVRCYRMQSRNFQVIGQGGQARPMFFGEWKDGLGNTHRKGMADLLLTPVIKISTGHGQSLRLAVPLWVECKAGSGKLNADQAAFRDDVLAAGCQHLVAHDSADPVIEWFYQHGVSRG